ncbi:MAG: CDP-diacylglycerol--glycerol-3-phosphate 3-phosphatidyltransferase [Puniceicoccales bacterium]|jgi:CDP-diacylglycerol--glycerol-3-phosphate 3-phosphatidyltransferase|nr:CDP-diacylglycerol--glycerol-3-phosphate 3-phosphatidyltransferase [Puniceicoccales bacterium]
MNLPNLITLIRFPLLFIIALLLYFPFVGSRSLAFLLYLASGFSDWLDGYIARRCDMVSNFGKFMDALSDKILMLGLFIVLLVIGILPSIFVFLILFVLGREFFVTGIRLVAASRNIIISAERSGKIKTIIQMISVGSLICSQAVFFDGRFLLPSRCAPCLAYLAFALLLFGYVLFLVAVVCAIESGIRYTKKYRFIFSQT